MYLANPNGNVGIGTTDPNTKLDVQNTEFKQGRFWNPGSSQQLWVGSVWDSIGSFIGNNAYYYSSYQFTPNYTAASGINFRQDGSTEFWNDTGFTSGINYIPTKRMVILSSGNVGIGTTGPEAQLHVGTNDGAKDNTQKMRIALEPPSHTGAAWMLKTRDDPTYAWFDIGYGTGNVISFRHDGNVGIGTTGPQVLLHVGSLSGATQAYGDYPALFISKPTQHTVPTAEIKHSPGNSGCGGCQNIALKIGVTDNQGSSKQNIGLWVDANSAASNYAAIFNTGNVGIGTTGLGDKLAVADSANNLSVSLRGKPVGTSDLYLGSTSPATRLQLRSDDNTGGGYIGNPSGYPIYFFTNGIANTKMTILNTGNVGIGTTGPTTKLHVVGSAGADPYVLIKSQDTTNYGGFLADAPLQSHYRFALNGALKWQWRVGAGTGADDLRAYSWTLGNDVMTMTTSGNVGIGTTGPASKLHIYNNATFNSSPSTLTVESFSNATFGNYEVGEIWLKGGNGTTSKEFRIQVVGPDHPTMANKLTIWDQTASQYRMVIDNVGNVGIGTTGPASKLEIRQDVLAYNTQGATISFNPVQLTSWAAPKAQITALVPNPDGHSGSGNLIFRTSNDGTMGDRMTINYLGNVGIGTASPAKPLHIRATDDTTGTGAFVRVHNSSINGGTKAGISFMHYDWATGGIWTERSDPALVFGTNPDTSILQEGGLTSRMVILRNGNVGIGTTGPNQKLHVNGNTKIIGTDAAWAENLCLIKSSGWGGVRFARYDPALGNYDGNWAIGYNAATGNDFSISNNVGGTQYDGLFHIKQSGNVGIGTTGPGSKLQVNSEIAHTYPTPGLTKGSIHINPAGTNDNSASITFGANSTPTLVDSGQAGIYVQSSGGYGTKMYFGTSNWYATGSKVRMMIDQLGNVGIGTAGPGSRLAVVSAGNGTEAYFTVLPQNLTQSVNIGYNHIFEAGTNGNNALYIDSQSTGNLLLQANGGSGNVGIGTTGPVALLDIYKAAPDSAFTETIRITNPSGTATGRNTINWYNSSGGMTSARIYSQVGSAYNDSIFFIDVADTSRVLQQRLTINSGGNVGIGTASPSYKLHVIGNIGIDQPSYIGFANGQTIRDNGNGGLALSSGYRMDFTAGTNGVAGNNAFTFNTGNVGIGTTGPQYKLDINNSGANPGARLPGKNSLGPDGYFVGVPTYGFRWNSSDDAYNNVIMYDNGNMYVRGNVGIGTTGPNRKLFVAGSGGTYDSILMSNGFLEVDGVNANGAASGGTSNLRFGYFAADRVGFNLQGAEVMSLKTSGNVGIGTTTANATGLGNAKLSVSGGTIELKQNWADAYGFVTMAKNTDAFIRIGHNGTKGIFGSTYNSTAGFTPLSLQTSDVDRLTILANGNVGIGTTGFLSRQNTWYFINQGLYCY